MSDIRERLRRANREGLVTSGFSREADTDALKALCGQAADEIDNLRSRLEMQEPVAWRYCEGRMQPWKFTDFPGRADLKRREGADVEPLYIAPPAGRSEAEAKAEKLRETAGQLILAVSVLNDSELATRLRGEADKALEKAARLRNGEGETG